MGPCHGASNKPLTITKATFSSPDNPPGLINPGFDYPQGSTAQFPVTLQPGGILYMYITFDPTVKGMSYSGRSTLFTDQGEASFCYKGIGGN